MTVHFYLASVNISIPLPTGVLNRNGFDGLLVYGFTSLMVYWFKACVPGAQGAHRNCHDSTHIHWLLTKSIACSVDLPVSPSSFLPVIHTLRRGVAWTWCGQQQQLRQRAVHVSCIIYCNKTTEYSMTCHVTGLYNVHLSSTSFTHPAKLRTAKYIVPTHLLLSS